MRKIAITLSALIGATIAFALPGFADTTYFRDGVNVTGTLAAFDHNCPRFQFFDLDENTLTVLAGSGVCFTGFVAGSGEDREFRGGVEAFALAEQVAAAKAAAEAAAEAAEGETESL
jgi:hypothetical protein